MASITLKEITPTSAKVKVQVNLDSRGSTGYNTDVRIYKSENGWAAMIAFDDMPAQESPEAAFQRLGLYCQCMAKALKGKNIKHLNIDGLFKPKHK